MDHTGLPVCSRTVLLLLSTFLFTLCLSLEFEDRSHKQKYIVEVNPASESSDESVDTVDSAGSALHEVCFAATLEGRHRRPVIDELSYGEHEPAAPWQVGEAVGGATRDIKWDERGYVTFCQRIGNFGNQMEFFLGMLAFAKALDRTLIIPNFSMITFQDGKIHNSVPFLEFFQISPLLEFHRVVTTEVFLTLLAPRYWRPGQRKGYVYQIKDDTDCNKACCWSNWNHPVEFDECFLHKLSTYQTDIADEKSMFFMRNSWNSKFPVEEHPVLTLNRATTAFPANAGNRKIQKFVKWNKRFVTIARSYINDTFGNNTWVGLHLRNGGDWVKACTAKKLSKSTFIMASPQCHEKKVGAVSKNMCLPSVAHMLELTLKVLKNVNAKHLFIATDKHPHIEDFRKVLSPIEIVYSNYGLFFFAWTQPLPIFGDISKALQPQEMKFSQVSVHHLNPKTPQVDLVILGQADYFIGTCPSSFTSFVKRERDASRKPSLFWGQEYNIGF